MSLRFLILSPLSTPLLSCTVSVQGYKDKDVADISDDTPEDVDSLNSRYVGIVVTALKDHDNKPSENNGNKCTVDIDLNSRSSFVIMYASYSTQPSACTFCLVCPKSKYSSKSRDIYSRAIDSISSSLLSDKALSGILFSEVSSENSSYIENVNSSTVNTLSIERDVEEEDPETVDWLVMFEETVVRKGLENLLQKYGEHTHK